MGSCEVLLLRLADTDNGPVSAWAQQTAGVLAGRLRASGVDCATEELAAMLDRRAVTLAAALGWDDDRTRAYLAADGLDDIVAVMTTP